MAAPSLKAASIIGTRNAIAQGSEQRCSSDSFRQIPISHAAASAANAGILKERYLPTAHPYAL